MDCNICQLPRSKFFCNTCLSNHLREYNAALSHIISSRDTHIQNASHALENIGPRRVKRAEKATLSEKVTGFRTEAGRVREESETVRSRIALRRERLQRRHDHLERARAALLSSPTHQQQEKEQKENLEKAILSTSLSLARARAGLVSELVEVFDVAQIHHPKDKEPKGMGSIHRREFTILGQRLPVPGDLTRLVEHSTSSSQTSATSAIASLSASSFLSLTPTDADPALHPHVVNATITHILHFLQLLTFYLGVKLPFEITWSTSTTTSFIERGLVGVGHPYVGSAPGTDGKYAGPYPLFIPPQASKQTTDKDKETQDFPSALALLLYNISYLSYTQGLTPTLSGAGEVLRNIWHIIYLPELGRKSHAPSLHPLPALVGMGFTMDIEQLMQAQAVGGKRQRKDSGRDKDRSKNKRSGKTLEVVEEGDGDEDWDLV